MQTQSAKRPLQRTTFAILLGLSCFVTFIRSNIAQAASKTSVVVAYHPEAVVIGEEILARGGNAFDAFVAVTFAQYVLSEGVTSAAGPLGALTYHAGKKEVLYLDGWFNDPLHPKARWKEGDPLGKTMLVPGAIRALEAINRKYGNLSWQDCLKPAIRLASDGFKVNWILAIFLRQKNTAELLKKSEYGRKTYFHANGEPFSEGETLKLPEMARFLMRLSNEGADYAYRGAWANKVVSLAQNLGGKITLEDLSRYQAEWRAPTRIQALGHVLYSNSGRSFGAIWTNMAIKALENFKPEGTHSSTSANDLEKLIRLTRALENEEPIFDRKVILSPAQKQSYLTTASAKKVWTKTMKNVAASSPDRNGTHSYAVSVIDSEGNAVTGTHTINSTPFASGQFVEGVPLSDAPKIMNEFHSVAPGERRIDPLSMHMVFEGENLRLALSSFNFTYVGQFHYLTNFLIYGMPVKTALDAPQFSATSDEGETLLSLRVRPEIVSEMQKRGIKVKQQKQMTGIGLGAGAEIFGAGDRTGAIVPIIESLSENSPERGQN